ncbi:MAG: ketoacyl-synthetase C-terminal extension domain-containing protein, partial [Pirellulales bacterium]
RLLRLEGSAFYLNDRLRPWPRRDRPARAGVCALGLGGTNAHLVLEEAPAIATRRMERQEGMQGRAQLFTVSARSRKSLRTLVERYVHRIEKNPGANLGDICFTANTGRAHWAKRWACVVTNLSELRTALAEFLQSDVDARDDNTEFLQPLKRPNIGLLYSDLSESRRVGSCLYSELPVFRRAIDEILRNVRLKTGTQPKDGLFEGRRYGGLDEGATLNLQHFALQVGLTAIWNDWGVVPVATAGVGLGEITAGRLSDSGDLDRALKMLLEGAKLEGSSGLGAIRAFTSSAVVERLVTGQVAVAALGMDDCLAIGGHTPITNLRRALEAMEVRVAAVVDAKEQLEAVKSVETATKTLERAGVDVLLEVGLSSVDSESEKRQWEARGRSWVVGLAHQAYDDVWRQLLTALGRLYFKGFEVDWQRFYQFSAWRRLALPTYPFEHERYWVEVAHAATGARTDQPRLTDSQASSRTTMGQYPLHPLLDECLSFDGADPGSCAS